MSGRANRALRGFAVHDDRVCLGNLADNDAEPENSSYTQTGGRPGTTVVVDELGTFRPQVHHAQEQDVTVVAIRPGVPSADTGAGLGYRVAGQEDIDTRGWNEPNLVTSYQPVDWTTTNDWTQADAVTCPRSQIVVVVADDVTVTAGVSVFRFNPQTAEWNGPDEIETPNIATRTQSCLCVLRETGRILLASLQTGGNISPMTLYYSDDDGLTWATYSEPQNLAFSDPGIARIRMVQDAHGNLLLVATDETTGDYWQFVSTDSGATFVEVESDTAFGTLLCLGVTASGLIVVVSRDFVGQQAEWMVLEDAFDPISEGTSTNVNGTNDVDQIALAVDYDGMIYVALTVEDSDVVKMARSADAGSTFDLYDRDLVATGGSVSGPTDHRTQVRAMTAAGGQLVLLANTRHVGTSPSTDGSLIALTLGGWSSVEWPSGSILLSDSDRLARVSFADAGDQDLNGIFLPGEILENQGWAPTGTTETRISGHHSFAAVAGNSFATLTFAGHATRATAVLVEARVEDGGDVNNDDLTILYVRRDGSFESRVRIRLAETGFRVRDDDVTTQTTLATVTMDMTADVVQFLILSANRIASQRFTTVLYKLRRDTRWTIAAQDGLAGTATVDTTDQVRVGIVGTATGDIRFGAIGWGTADSLVKWKTGLENNSNFTQRLYYGKSLGPAPYPIRDLVDLDGRVSFLAGSGGAARLQERWQIPATFDYGVAELDPCLSPSPDAQWRSLDTAEQILTWDLGIDSRIGHSWALAAGFVRANFHQALIEASTAAAPTVWVQLGAYIAFVATSVTFTRQGDLVFPAAGTPPGAMFFTANSLTGGQAILDPSGVPPYCMRIVGNQGGGWQDHGAQAVLQITGLSGAEPTSGTMHIVAPSGVLVMHHAAPAAYRRIRLRIPEQDTPDGYFSLGAFTLGSVWPMGRQWSRGWSWRWTPIVRTEENDTGTIFVEDRAPVVNGGLRRELTVSWQDGYDATQIQSGSPRYLAASGSSPALAADLDVRGQLVGLLRSSRAAALPSLALLEIPPVTKTILDPDLWSYGRLGIGQDLQVNNVQGDEGRNEVYRVESLTHVELV
jgi:hypothetical protein